MGIALQFTTKLAVHTAGRYNLSRGMTCYFH